VTSEKSKSFAVIEAAPQAAIKDFKDLEVWQVARELRTAVYSVARLVPEFEKYALAA